MQIEFSGYQFDESENEPRAEEFKVFIEHLELVLKNQTKILDTPDLFFSNLAFAWCSWPYIDGDGPLCIGYLFKGWEDGILCETCPKCKGQVLVVSFSGSPLSGRNDWTGVCVQCNKSQSHDQSIHTPFLKRIEFVRALRQNPHGLTISVEEAVESAEQIDTERLKVQQDPATRDIEFVPVAEFLERLKEDTSAYGSEPT